ncbi:MAG: sulfite exporter TauE/SafE family protein [Syntrophobacterales bacterium]|nr:sulfite exporter TauE/SafE family protein [Syntrophobacterales bacterium]
MKKRYKVMLIIALVSLFIGWVGFIHKGLAQEKVGSISGLSKKLSDIVASTPKCSAEVKKGCINPEAPRGYLDIPGAPKPSYLLAFLWALWVGWIFSTVGAFGGIMAGVGHITVFGLGDYAKSFKDTNKALNKFITDTIRVSNQFLVGLSAIISSISYAKSRQLCLPLGVALGVGSIVGATIIPWLTAGKITAKTYTGLFGLIVFVVAGFMYYGTTQRALEKRRKTQEAAKRFQEAARQGATKGEGVKLVCLRPTQCTISFYGVEFSFNLILGAFGGLVVAAISALIGVGGGFLLVPLMTDVMKLPMFIAAGTSAFAVLVSMVTSIFNYMVQGVIVWWPLIGTELVGIFVGSIIGPMTQKYIPDIWLKRLFVVLALYVGIKYTSEGFLGKSIIP